MTKTNSDPFCRSSWNPLHFVLELHPLKMFHLQIKMKKAVVLEHDKKPNGFWHRFFFMSIMVFIAGKQWRSQSLTFRAETGFWELITLARSIKNLHCGLFACRNRDSCFTCMFKAATCSNPQSKDVLRHNFYWQQNGLCYGLQNRVLDDTWREIQHTKRRKNDCSWDFPSIPCLTAGKWATNKNLPLRLNPTVLFIQQKL